MKNQNQKKVVVKAKRSPVSLISQSVKQTKTSGKYDKKSDTWSNRNYETSAQKKHNEEM